MMNMMEKIAIAHDLAVVLGEYLNDEILIMNDNDADTIWGHADGLTARRLYDLRDGNCSLAASINCDLEKEEIQLDKDIEIMENIINKLSK